MFFTQKLSTTNTRNQEKMCSSSFLDETYIEYIEFHSVVLQFHSVGVTFVGPFSHSTAICICNYMISSAIWNK